MCSVNILNSGNNLVFDTDLGSAGNFGSNVTNGKQISHLYISQHHHTSEPSISVIEDNFDEEELVSHSIIEKTRQMKMKQIPNHLSNGKELSIGGLFKSNQSTSKPRCKLQKDIPLQQCSSIEFSNRSIYKIKKRKSRHQSKLKHSLVGKNSNDVVSIINKNKDNKIKYFGMKVMVDPQTGEYIFRSSYTKSTSNETFNAEPWMLHRPRILEQPKEKLFILNVKKHDKAKVVDLGTSISLGPQENEALETTSISIFPKEDIMDTGIGFAMESTSVSSKEFRNLSTIGNGKAQQITDGSNIVYWEEGNIDKLTSDYCTVSEIFKKPTSVFDEEKKIEFPDYLCLETYESPIATKSGAAPGVGIWPSWKAVKERIEEITEETMTRFIQEHRSAKFLHDPQPFQSIYFELDTMRKNVPVIIPKTGIPFMYLGFCLFTCHLARRKWKRKEEDVARSISKKIGCPAKLSIARVARFPDFEIPVHLLTSKREKAVLSELKDAWDFNHEKVRYYIEYHLNEPSPSDHKGHEVQYLVNSNRFKETVDPRILEKIRDLMRTGITTFKNIQEKVQKFIREELFKGVPNPPLERRRYNPSQRDIRYAMVKAKEELKKEGKSLVQLQCSALASDISQMVKDITEEDYLNHIKFYLNTLHKGIKAKDPLVNLRANRYSEVPKRIPRKRQVKPRSVSPTAVDASLLLEQHIAPEPIPEQAIEQFYISVPETGDAVFNSQLYPQDFVDINGGMVDALPTVPDEGAVPEVYYYYPDGTCELAVAADVLDGVQG